MIDIYRFYQQQQQQPAHHCTIINNSGAAQWSHWTFYKEILGIIVTAPIHRQVLRSNLQHGCIFFWQAQGGQGGHETCLNYDHLTLQIYTSKLLILADRVHRLRVSALHLHPRRLNPRKLCPLSILDFVKLSERLTNKKYSTVVCSQSVHQQSAVTTSNFYLCIFLFPILRSSAGVHKRQGWFCIALMVYHKCQSIKNFKTK